MKPPAANSCSALLLLGVLALTPAMTIAAQSASSHPALESHTVFMGLSLTVARDGQAGKVIAAEGFRSLIHVPVL